MNKPVCVVVGIGPGIGSALVRRFAADGYAVAMLTRNLEHTTSLAGLADCRPYACDAADPSSITAALDAVARDLGDPEVLLWNAGGGAFGSIDQIGVDDFEAAWRVNALGAFAACKHLLPSMKARGHGSILFVGATASVKGGARTVGFSSAKMAQRGLAQSMARQLWPAGIHVALIVVDGVVDLASTRQRMADKPDAFFIQPDAVAATALQLVKQDRSGWSFEVEARPFGESW